MLQLTQAARRLDSEKLQNDTKDAGLFRVATCGGASAELLGARFLSILTSGPLF